MGVGCLLSRVPRDELMPFFSRLIFCRNEKPQAGGKSTTGTERVMDINPQQVHQRVPTFLGSKEDVDELMKAYAE